MGLTAIISAIGMASHYAMIAAQIGQDVSPFIVLIRKWTEKDAQVTQTDIDSLHAMAKPYFDMLNDTSRDV